MAKKEIKAVQRLIKLEADANGSVTVPDRIHLMSAGHWHTPYHGAFEMTTKDLAEMVVNFENSVASVEGSKKLPINYGHDISGKAAGWITALTLENGGDELWGTVEWTPLGRQMLEDGELRYISPEWNPRDWPYENPEVEGEFFDNVLSGAGLTNNPLFKKLTPIMASIDAGAGDKSRQHQGGDMDLAALRSKKKDELSAEELVFVTEHKAELTDEERTAFELTLDTDAAAEAANGQTASAAPKGLTAAQKAQWDKLTADAAAGRQASEDLRRSRLTASVNAGIERGAVKSDQAKSTVDLLMASTPAQEKAMLTFIENLPSNSMIASEHGSAAGGDATASATLFDKARTIMASAKVNVDVALKQARKENPDLAKQFDQEQKEAKESK